METVTERWVRWDRLINNKKYVQLIKEFDLLLTKKTKLTIGDLIRREEALENIGIVSFNKEKTKKTRGQNGSKRRKS